MLLQKLICQFTHLQGSGISDYRGKSQVPFRCIVCIAAHCVSCFWSLDKSVSEVVVFFPVSRWKVFKVFCRRWQRPRARAEAHAGLGLHWVSTERTKGLCTHWYVNDCVYYHVNDHCINCMRKKDFFLSPSCGMLFVISIIIIFCLNFKILQYDFTPLLTRAPRTCSRQLKGNMFWKIREMRPLTPSTEVRIIYTTLIIATNSDDSMICCIHPFYVVFIRLNHYRIN